MAMYSCCILQRNAQVRGASSRVAIFSMTDVPQHSAGDEAREPAARRPEDQVGAGLARAGDPALLGSLATGLLSIFSLQLVSRVLTFGLNIAIARSVDRRAFGVGSVQLQLVCDTVLALSREGFRDACQRTHARGWQDPTRRLQVLAVAWLCVPLAAVVGSVVLAISSFAGSGEAEDGLSAAGISAMFVAAAGLEMLSEPLYILAHNMLLITVRVRVEMAALAAKVVTTGALVALFPSSPLRAFGLGQMAYGFTMLAGFSSYFVLSKEGLGLRETAALLSGWRTVQLFTGRAGALVGEGEGGKGSGVDWQLLEVVGSMSMKALFKYLLEKGETLVLLRLFAAETWAMYGLVQNLASLVVRLVFLPVEDMAQLAFSKLLSSNMHASAAEVYGVLVKLVVIIGAVAAAFGPGYAYTVVHLLYGSRWSATDMPAMLSWYSTYVLFLALNGVTEAFVHASISGGDMRRRSGMLLLVTVAYLAISSVLAPLVGVRALVAGNCINMALRTSLSLRHASVFFSSHGDPPGDGARPVSCRVIRAW
jgi:oligosaccharide translocation protein RFT1